MMRIYEMADKYEEYRNMLNIKCDQTWRIL